MGTASSLELDRTDLSEEPSPWFLHSFLHNTTTLHSGSLQHPQLLVKQTTTMLQWCPRLMTTLSMLTSVELRMVLSSMMVSRLDQASWEVLMLLQLKRPIFCGPKPWVIQVHSWLTLKV